MKSREIKKVSEAEILRRGSEIGTEVLKAFQSIGKSKLNEDSVICEIENWTELDSILNDLQVNVQIVKKGSSASTLLETQLLEAYQYNLENDAAATSSIQRLDKNSILFAYSIDRNSAIYKYCMDSTAQKNAAMWSIKIPVKEIITRL